MVLPARLTVLSISLIALAALAFVATQPGDDRPDVATPVVATPSETPAPVVTTAPPLRPAVKRKTVYVEVYNNSNVKGLAGQVAASAQALGWNVVGSDNWYGTVDASTVYFPAKLKRAAQVLAKDLDIARTKPAIAPMRMDRLTVILTGDRG